MPHLLTPALVALLLAGCSTPEPQNTSYAPAATSVAPLPPPAQPMAPTFQGQSAQPAPDGQPTQSPPGDFAEAPPFQHTPTCSTVDGVTLCDAAVDPNAADPLYTN